MPVSGEGQGTGLLVTCDRKSRRWPHKDTDRTKLLEDDDPMASVSRRAHEMDVLLRMCNCLTRKHVPE